MYPNINAIPRPGNVRLPVQAGGGVDFRVKNFASSMT
jgi:hypothetical protein